MARKTFITDILASIEKKQKETAAQPHQPRTKADLLRRVAAPGADRVLGCASHSVGRDACLSLAKMAGRQEEALRPRPPRGVARHQGAQHAQRPEPQQELEHSVAYGRLAQRSHQRSSRAGQRSLLWLT